MAKSVFSIPGLVGITLGVWDKDLRSMRQHPTSIHTTPHQRPVLFHKVPWLTNKPKLRTQVYKIGNPWARLLGTTWTGTPRPSLTQCFPVTSPHPSRPLLANLSSDALQMWKGFSPRHTSELLQKGMSSHLRSFSFFIRNATSALGTDNDSIQSRTWGGEGHCYIYFIHVTSCFKKT